MDSVLDKVAEAFKAGSRFLDDDERMILAAATETVLLEKQAGRLGELSEDQIVLLSAAVADNLLKE